MGMHVAKERERVGAVAGDWYLEGDLHLLEGSRMTDALNRKDDFLALTDVVVCDARTRQEMFRSGFMNLNRLSVLSIWPLDEVEQYGKEDDPLAAKIQASARMQYPSAG